MRSPLRQACSASALLFCSVAFAQQTRRPEFEVALIKRTAIDDTEFDRRLRAGELQVGSRIHGNTAEYIRMTLRQLVAAAYQVKSAQVTGPEWLGSGAFDIVCRLPAGSRKEDAPSMLQSLLADRFHLVAHREMREEDVKALVVARGGVKLRESPSEMPGSGDPKQGLAEQAGRSVAKKQDGGTGMLVGVVRQRILPGPDSSSVRVEFSRISMADLANFLGKTDVASGRNVVDMTALGGQYDMVLDIPMAELVGVQVAKTDAESASAPEDAPPLLQSLKRFGLELRNRRARVEYLIVDHAERMPTGN